MTIAADLTGFYVLTAKGELGTYDADAKKTFVVNTRLTDAFASHNARFLNAYLQEPNNAYFRVAIIYRPNEKKAWNSETLVLEKAVVRELYPVGGSSGAQLTSFQKKTREKSVYRGMELLLDYHSDAHPDIPFFCPVLFDKGVMLDGYLATLGREAQEGDDRIPVIEVLNLTAPIPMSKRDNAAVKELKQTIYKGIVKKGKRKSSRLQLLNQVGVGSTHGSAEEAYSEVDKRSEKMVTVPAVTRDKAANSEYPDPFEDDFYKKLERWLERPPEPPDPEFLKKFVTFQDFSEEALLCIASNSLIYFVAAGTPLLERGKTDNWNLYLVEGKLELVAADGIQKFIETGTDNAFKPVSFLRPRKYTVSAYSRASFIWIHDAVVEDVRKKHPLVKRTKDSAKADPLGFLRKKS